jgi:8-oxo-dGTP pyrophosphatase MutT (NUDIX family)
MSVHNWQHLITHVGTHECGVQQHLLPMVRHLDGRPARVNTPPPGAQPRPAAVLVVVTADTECPTIILTKRGGGLREHGGEISLPGGRVEAHETAVQTALREADEELAVDATCIDVIGTLHPVYVPRSNHLITPVLAWNHTPFLCVPNPAEVDAVLYAPLPDLLADNAVVYEPRHINGYDVEVPFFWVAGHKVWGATALVLCDLVARIRVTTTPSFYT